MRLEKLLKALANRRRLTIVDMLRTRSRSVSEIASGLRLSIRSTSRHLQVLARADIVDHTQVGTVRSYHLTDPPHPITSSIIAFKTYSHE